MVDVQIHKSPRNSDRIGSEFRGAKVREISRFYLVRTMYAY